MIQIVPTFMLFHLSLCILCMHHADQCAIRRVFDAQVSQSNVCAIHQDLTKSILIVQDFSGLPQLPRQQTDLPASLLDDRMAELCLSVSLQD